MCCVSSQLRLSGNTTTYFQFSLPLHNFPLEIFDSIQAEEAIRVSGVVTGRFRVHHPNGRSTTMAMVCPRILSFPNRDDPSPILPVSDETNSFSGSHDLYEMDSEDTPNSGEKTRVGSPDGTETATCQIEGGIDTDDEAEVDGLLAEMGEEGGSRSPLGSPKQVDTDVESDDDQPDGIDETEVFDSLTRFDTYLGSDHEGGGTVSEVEAGGNDEEESGIEGVGSGGRLESDNPPAGALDAVLCEVIAGDGFEVDDEQPSAEAGTLRDDDGSDEGLDDDEEAEGLDGDDDDEAEESNSAEGTQESDCSSLFADEDEIEEDPNADYEESDGDEMEEDEEVEVGEDEADADEEQEDEEEQDEEEQRGGMADAWTEDEDAAKGSSPIRASEKKRRREVHTDEEDATVASPDRKRRSPDYTL